MNWASILLDCCVAFIGGCLGAALSALGGFLIFGLVGVLGFLYLLVAHDDVWIRAVTGSVLLTPSVCFLGGVIATAYARRQKLIQCGKDIGRSFVTYRRFDILAVGGCAGLTGLLVNRGIDKLLAGSMDTVALTIFVVPLFFKHLCHMTKTNDCEASSHAVPSPYRFFEKFSRPKGKTLTALAIGLCTALLTFWLFQMPDTKPYAGLFVFVVSAVLLFPVFMGIPVPATHHFSGPAGAVAVLWLSLNGDAFGTWGIALVALWSVAAAQLGLLASRTMERLFFTEGDIHIDPPAMGIAVSTAIMLGALPLTSVYGTDVWTQVAVSLFTITTTCVLNVTERCPQLQTVRDKFNDGTESKPS